MADRIVYSQCPSCFSNHVSQHLIAVDHTVSHASFEIWHCTNCSLRFTQSVPQATAIGRYYQSENYISHTDTNKGIVNQLYRLARRFTLRNKRNVIETHGNISKGSLLDLGAGTGAFASYMQQSGWTVTGVEPDEQARKKAADTYSVQLYEASRFFELEENWFDVITLWHVIEHVHSLHEYITQLKKILRPRGVLFIAVPNYTSYDAGLYGSFWAAYDVPRHLYHFSPVAMKKLVQSHGLQLKKIQAMWLDSFYISLLSEKNKAGRVNLVKGFWNGAVSNLKALSQKERASSLIYIICK